jgi:hypothetical protein
MRKDREFEENTKMRRMSMPRRLGVVSVEEEEGC